MTEVIEESMRLTGVEMVAVKWWWAVGVVTDGVEVAGRVVSMVG